MYNNNNNNNNNNSSTQHINGAMQQQQQHPTPIGSFPPPLHGVVPQFGGSMDASSKEYWSPHHQYLSPGPPDAFPSATLQQQQQQQQQQQVLAQQQFMQQHGLSGGFSNTLGSAPSGTPSGTSSYHHSMVLPVIRETSTESNGTTCSSSLGTNDSNFLNNVGSIGSGGGSSTPLPEQIRRAQLAIGEIQKTMGSSNMHANSGFNGEPFHQHGGDNGLMFQVVSFLKEFVTLFLFFFFFKGCFQFN